MSKKKYINFVKPVSPSEEKVYSTRLFLRGEDAKKLYLEEVRDIGDPEPVTQDNNRYNSTKRKRRASKIDNTHELTDKDLFLSAQHNDTRILTQMLDRYPDKINTLDDYGWSLLMIACQANSIEVVKELLSRNINTSIRDKAGNSAQSLVIKNKNLALVDILLAHKKNRTENETQKEEEHKVKLKEEYPCEICNKTYPDKQEHLSSTIHNINASKGKKIHASYVIPASNKGYQLMLKDGWDRQSGLGPEGSGKLYPIKTVQKKDRKGLGHKITKEGEKDEPLKQHKKIITRFHQNNRRLEINFRREFY